MRRLPNNAFTKALVKFLQERFDIPVFDYLPEDVSLPFITFGSVTVKDQSTKTDDAVQLTMHIHIWSDYKGRFELNNIAERLIRLLGSEQIDLEADGFYVSAQGVDFYETYPEDDGGYSGEITFETLIQSIVKN